MRGVTVLYFAAVLQSQAGRHPAPSLLRSGTFQIFCKHLPQSTPSSHFTNTFIPPTNYTYLSLLNLNLHVFKDSVVKVQVVVLRERYQRLNESFTVLSLSLSGLIKAAIIQ